MPIRAVTFDFWNTLMWEPAGALVAARLERLISVLGQAGHEIDRQQLLTCHEVAFQAYQSAWRANKQYCVPEAVDTMLEVLGVADLASCRDDMVEAFSVAGRATPIELAEGVEDCLRTMAAAGIRLGIICDIGLTPSPVLRWHLEQRGLLDLFDAAVFSDETGVYKPDPAAFHHALALLGTEPAQAAHVGDRKRTDVGGALDVGMTAVRYRGVYDDPGSDGPDASIVIDDYQPLPGLLAEVP